MTKGRLSKKVLGDFLESECERQLFLSLGKNRKNWGLEDYDIEKLERERVANYIIQIGKEYEQKVYNKIENSAPSCLNINQIREQKNAPAQLTKSFLLNIYDKFAKNPNLKECCLLEYDFETPESCIRDLFQLETPQKEDKEYELPTSYSHTLRPDIILIGNKKSYEKDSIGKVLDEKNPILMIDSDGKIRKVPESIKHAQLGINIIDVKATREEKIGKRHFFEIIFYWKTLTRFLEENGLNDKFYVRVDNNGIFSGYNDLSELKGTNIREWIVKLPFQDTIVLYDHISETLKSLVEEIPCNIDEIPIRLQSICSRCAYLEDCKKHLGYGDDSSRKDWDLCLLPYMSQNISEELKDLNKPRFQTIHDVAEHISDYESDSVPTPLFAEKPFLKYRAQSLLDDIVVTPEANEISSIAIPRRSPISLIMDFETDPMHDIMCAASFNLNIFIGSWKSTYLNFKQWWTIWEQYLNGECNYKEAVNNLEQIFVHIDFSDPHIKKQISSFKKSLKRLIANRRNKMWPWLTLEKESRSGETNFHRIILPFALVNWNFTQESENDLSEQLITLLYDLIIFIQTLEWILSTENDSLQSAVYYWSRVQLEHLQEFLERNLDYVNENSQLRRRMLYIIRWFNPAESSVEHPYHHKKIYDLRPFAENTLNVPLIINYTWHGVAHYLSTDPQFSKYFGGEKTFYHVYWNRHFNYIDFQQWYRYISLKKKNPKKAAEQRRELVNQMLIKARTIDKLRRLFQDIGKQFIAGHSKPKPMEDFFNFDLSKGSHQIAQLWHLFEQYTSARNKLEVDRLRSLFPEYGIGRLESAKTNKLHMMSFTRGTTTKYSYQFQLKGISSNVKIAEGEWVTLIPEIIRHQPRFKLHQWKVVIEKMKWETDHWQVSTRPWKNNIIEHYIKDLNKSIKWVDGELEEIYKRKIKQLKTLNKKSDNYKKPLIIEDTFHLYPRASSPWKKKLEALFKRYEYGKSWLGKVLAYKWKISAKKKLKYPQDFPCESWLPDIYIYAPYLLPKFEPRKEALFTPIAPKPDLSQKEAILQSLTHSIYGIQGPPGTGKSQTIAALIDEYILRNKNQKPLKILVTSFSYAALRVVFNNIIMSKNQDGTPTKAAHSTCAFMRSQDREKVVVNEPYWDLTFRDKQKTLVLERISESAEGKISSQTEIVTKDTTEKLEDILSKDESNLILFGNAHQLFHLHSTYSYRQDLRFIHRDFHFDLIVIDEASQLPVNYFLSALQFIKKYRFYVCSDHFNAKAGNIISSPKELEALYLSKNLNKKANKNEFQSNELTKVVIVGDQNQLPPVHPVKPPKKLEPILDNLFGYYCDHHSVPNKQLEFNYRSNQKIVDFTNFLDIYTNQINAKTNENAKINHSLKKIQDWNASHPFKLEKWIQEALDPSKIMGTFIHNRKYETAVSELEADIVSKLIMGYYIMSMPNLKKTKNGELENAELAFWQEKLGVVAPHNAQGRLIIKKIYELFTECNLNFLTDQKLMNLLKTTVVSVEKFQGSARDVIIASIGISARDQLMAETEFIYDLNRFNVLTSRARKKFLLICSENFLKFIPEDRTLMKNAAKIRRFAYEFCTESRIISASEEINDTKLQFRYLK